MIKTIFELVDREGKVQMSDLVNAFCAYYLKQVEAGHPLEQGRSLIAAPANATDLAIKQLIITNPLERFQIKHFITYSEEERILQIAPQLWQSLGNLDTISTNIEALCKKSAYHLGISHLKVGESAPEADSYTPFLEMQ